MRYILFTAILSLFAVVRSPGQCCAGGSGSPIAGGASQGVLPERQVEINTNFQFINTDVFFSGSKKDTAKYFDRFRSTYQYFRVAYGVTKNFTFSLETGNYFNKEEIGRWGNPPPTYRTAGISDVIVFPRYDILNRTTENQRTEITVGLGFKIPVGSYNDSTGFDLYNGQKYYVTNPQAVQLSSGAHDIIFYGFLFRGYPVKKFRVFANMLYIKKGWNPLGERLGDFSSIGIFYSRSLTRDLAVTAQIRREWMDGMEINEVVLNNDYPNYDPFATGYKKVFFSPQVSYTKGKFTVYGLIDLPVYQYVTKTQVATEFQAIAGLSFRFFAVTNPAGASGTAN